MPSSCTNRPWNVTFTSALSRAMKPDANPGANEQVHKLARNLIASLDLGDSPNMKLAREIDQGKFPEKMTGKERYLLWVQTWRDFYAGLSSLIRYAKKNNRDEVWRLKETAQVMLNARRVGKLASWAIVQRQKRLNAT